MSAAMESNQPPVTPPDLTRRQLGIGLAVALVGGLGLAKRAAAFESGAQGNFNAASQVLGRYGVTVSGDTVDGHDRLNIQTVPLPGTEYRQLVGSPSPSGGINPSIETSILGDVASFTHIHPGAIIPCIKTTIEGDALATHEMFDPDQGGIIPCIRVETQMLEGGHIGDVTMTHVHAGTIIPCVKTSILGHALAVHEVFDAADGDIVPCVRVASEMREGGSLGAVEIDIDPDENGLVVRLGTKTYVVADGALQEIPR